jgi:Toprim-like
MGRRVSGIQPTNARPSSHPVVDWVKILEANGIEFRSRGANVAQGNVNIRCPWCADGDPSFHLGISLSGAGYGCWRSKAHRGKSVRYLLSALLGAETANRILEEEGLKSRGKPSRIVEPKVELRPRELEWPLGIEEYRPVLDKRFYAYLLSRGFDHEKTELLLKTYFLVGRHGEYSGRIIIPYYQHERVVYFTARAVANAQLRYKACENKLAVVDPQTLLFNEDSLTEAGGVILCEGPLDAIKCTVYGPLPAVALSTNHATNEQLDKLARARRVYQILDNDNLHKSAAGDVTEAALTLQHELIGRGAFVKVLPMPKGYKDLAEIPWNLFPKVINWDFLSCQSHSQPVASKGAVLP